MAGQARQEYTSGGDAASVETPYVDLEQNALAEARPRNTTVRNISWSGVTVTVKDRVTKKQKTIVDNVEGFVEAGEVLALMGPSGCGKTTLLNVLASRSRGAAHVDGQVLVNGTAPSKTAFRQISRFVEQEDALIGSLTVRETLGFACRLSSGTSSLSKRERAARIDGLLESFGLREQADTIIGTPFRKGISGGQKRRVGIASQLITSPEVLFLDEPTSGLDSAASFEVMRHLKDVAARLGLVVVASIHQPSTSTFNLFDRLLLLSGGRTHYFGAPGAIFAYYESVGHPVPLHVNPAEFLLDRVSVDFAPDEAQAQARHGLHALQQAWASSAMAGRLSDAIARSVAHAAAAAAHEKQLGPVEIATAERRPGFASLVSTLLHRSFIKSYRDVIAYGVRMAMYLGLAIMMGTVWLRLKTEQEYIQPYINAIFFGSAFMSFMAVAYVPAFLEDRSQYVKEFHDGLYGAGELVVSNFLVGLPPLFLTALGFSAASYWLSNLRPAADAFLTWVLWVFLDLVAAEGLVVLVSSAAPSPVAALALAALANGLWMCAGGFLVPPPALNAFYRYAVGSWDYQRWVFEGMLANELAGRAYACGAGCRCLYETELAGRCMIAGEGVLAQYGYSAGHLGRNVGIMVGIIAGYRIAAWLVLMWRR